MIKIRRAMAVGILSLTVAAVVAGSTALFASSSSAKPCRRLCPLYCIEVTCDDGQTYCNSCLAACAGAHNCHS